MNSPIKLVIIKFKYRNLNFIYLLTNLSNPIVITFPIKTN